MFLNKVLIIGNLTRDPELKTLPSGTQVTSFGIATNRVFRDRDGKNQEETQFHNIVVFGQQAENVAQYLKKGSNALIEGRIQNRSWDGPDGQKRYRTEIVAERVQFGPRRGGDGTPPPTSTKAKNEGAKKGDELETIDYPEEESKADDIPF